MAGRLVGRGRLGTRRAAVAAGAALAALMVSAACGTTVPNAAQRLAEGGRVGAGGADASGSAAPASGANGSSGDTATTTGAGGLGQGAVGGATPSTGSGGSGARTGAAGAAAGAPSVGGGGGGTSGAPTATAAAPGLTATTVNVGVVYTVNSAAANAAIGAAGISTGDTKANAQILIDDINAHGGVAGRKMVPVYHPVDAASTDTADSQFQAACDDFTQDHKVFAAFAGAYEVFLQCMHDRGATLVTDNLTVADAATFQRFPYYYEIGSLNLDRIATAQVAGMNAQGYFSGWDASLNGPAAAGGKAKVGIVTFDEHRFVHAVDQTLIPALAKLGYAPSPDDVVKISRGGGGTSDVGPQAAAAANAVLKFRSDGVEHVIVFDASGVLTLLFLNNAKSQRYYPRYGVNSQNGTQTLTDAGDIQKDQLIGTIGIGWIPGIDITASQNPDDGPYSNDQRRTCLALMKAHGQTYPNPNAETVVLNQCNAYWFFRQVMNAIGPTVSRDAFQAAVNKVGRSYTSTSPIPRFFGPNQHDGIAAIRYWSYKDDCGCLTYVSGDIAV